MAICNFCKADIVPTAWLPPAGIDPLLREYRCLACGRTWYQKQPHPPEKPKMSDSTIASTKQRR